MNPEALLIRHATVVTLDEAGRVLPDTDVAIEGGKIRYVGDIPAEFSASKVLEAENHVLVPGFFNAHTHAAMTLLRGFADDLPLDRWFNERIWVAESNLTPEDVQWGTALAAAEMIRSGTVGFADHYFHMDLVGEIVAEAGLKATLAWCVFGLEPEGEVGGGLSRTLEFIDRWQGAAEGRVRTVLGPHSPYVCPPAFLEKVGLLAKDRGLGLHIHLSESEEQVQNSLQRYGHSPVSHLANLGVLEVPTIAAHCIHLAPGDLEILAQKKVSVVQCPNCHMKLGMGVTPVKALQEAGIRVALGTDGCASNNDLDMLQEAQLCNLMHKNHHRDPELLKGETVLRMACHEGALALGFHSGIIAPGYAADLLLFNFDQPHLVPCHDVVSNLVHAARSSDISHVMVNGRLLMEKRQLLTLDEERIKAEAKKRALRMVGSSPTALRSYQG